MVHPFRWLTTMVAIFFLAACSQRTRRIRLGHGIALMPPAFNHPARVAERIAVLDLLSGGRVEWGTGESTTALELGGFGIDPAEKQAMWQEATEQAANMLALTPYPGFRGRYFEMPCRNLVPKPLQRRLLPLQRPSRPKPSRIAGAFCSVRIRSCSCTATTRCACCASWASSVS